MADFVPLYKPGHSVPKTVATTAVIGGRLVEINGAGTIGPAGAASIKVVGTAAQDAAVGDVVTVHVGGVQRLTASAAIAAGALVIAAAAGKVATAGAGTFDQVLGLAHTAASADGDLIEVQLFR
jgi:hypothetical protein